MRIANQPLWTPLASFALAAAWLLPNAQPPWVAFHKDAYLAFVLAIVCLPVIVRAGRHRAESSWDWLSLYLMGLSLLVLMQWRTGKLEFLGQAFIGTVFFVAAGFAIYIGRLWSTCTPGHVERFLMHAFVVGGLACAGMIYGQWAQIDLHPVWFNYLPPGERPYGNLNQANNAGSLLLLAMIAMGWLLLTAKVRIGTFLLAAAFLIGALVLTASRITFVSFVGLLVAATLAAWRLPRFRRYLWLPGILFIMFAVVFLLQQFGWEEAATNSNPLRRDLTGIRMAAYGAFGEAILHGPLSGFGFDQAVKAQLFAGNMGHKLPGLFGWTHNFVLDISVWFGWPIALLGVVLGGWSVFQLRRLIVDPTIVASFACVSVLLIHGMVELPLNYAYFLLPTCLLIGALFGRASVPALRLPLPVAGVFLVALSAALAMLASDYLRAESAFNAWRFKAARVGASPEKINSEILLLDHFAVLIDGLDTDPLKASTIDLKRFRSAVLSFPSPYALQRLVLFQAKAGDLRGAIDSIEAARLLTTKETNRDMAIQWRAWQKIDADLVGIEWPAD